jgi:hypothetical protein
VIIRLSPSCPHQAGFLYGPETESGAWLAASVRKARMQYVHYEHITCGY